jgi:hypothetical protein
VFTEFSGSRIELEHSKAVSGLLRLAVRHWIRDWGH